MFSKRLVERIESSFPEDDKESSKQYLDWLKDTLSDFSASLRRTVTVLILLVAIFEFVAESPRSTITVAGFPIQKGSIVFQFLPALVAYLYLQAIVDTGTVGWLRNAFSLTFARWSPEAEKNDLDALITSPFPLYWKPGHEVRSENEFGPELFEKITAVTFILVIYFGIVVFEAQAYWILFPAALRVSLVFWFISLVVTIFCLVMAQLHVRFHASSPRRTRSERTPDKRPDEPETTTGGYSGSPPEHP